MATVRYRYGEQPGFTPGPGSTIVHVTGAPHWFTPGVTRFLTGGDFGVSVYEPSPRYEEIGISNVQSIHTATLNWDFSSFLTGLSCAFGLWVVWPGDVGIDPADRSLYGKDMDQWYSYLQVGTREGPLDPGSGISSGVTGTLLDNLVGSPVSGSHSLQIPKTSGPHAEGEHQVGAEAVSFVLLWARDASMLPVQEALKANLWIDFDYAPGDGGVGPGAGQPSVATAGSPTAGSVRA